MLCTAPLVSRKVRNANHKAWLCHSLRSDRYTPKKTSIAAAVAANMPRVFVVPMKTPSQINAAKPQMGISTAHGAYSAEAATTSISSVSSRRNPVPPTAYTIV